MTKMNIRPLILVSNDDGVEAKGIRALVDAIKPLGDIIVVAPDGPRSAQSNAITVSTPLRVWKRSEESGAIFYRCNGTPSDCVKLALHEILDRKPDLVVAGINHGTNTSISVIYSGTMGAVIEGCVESVPSVGFSLCDHSAEADFSVAQVYANRICKKVLDEGLPKDTCINVNVPKLEDVKGMKVCRQADGRWNEEFVPRKDPYGGKYFWLTGSFFNREPEATDTDEAVLKAGYVSIVPCKVDLTDYDALETLKSWSDENE